MAIDYEEPDSFDEKWVRSRSVSVQCDEHFLTYDEHFGRSRSSSISSVIWEWGRRLLESDAKSLNSLASGHSRKSSSTSLVSVASADSKHTEEDKEEDVWQVWGSVVNEWETYFKKKNSFVKDLVRRDSSGSKPKAPNIHAGCAAQPSDLTVTNTMSGAVSSESECPVHAGSLLVSIASHSKV
ncbi:ecotropic viral integration site 5 ortholog [Caerostris extrusa]|uniref:Ecotropic viral integration site 5 ortholog n=1 Tax=Caerostris extrusa TaxID=172846 RepID=A0AAV4UTT7_CAEEX|nr:ecotropic viral integration site 5 ortholog [Caerostris extrusa]